MISQTVSNKNIPCRHYIIQKVFPDIKATVPFAALNM
jgi:hypothetical protein